MNNLEINKLIAEHVMGWKHRKAVFFYGEKIQPETWKNDYGYEIEWMQIPDFLRNLINAFEVVERLKDQYIFLTLTNNEDTYVVEFTQNDLSVSDRYYTTVIEDKSLPLAICKAALKLKGVEIDG